MYTIYTCISQWTVHTFPIKVNVLTLDFPMSFPGPGRSHETSEIWAKTNSKPFIWNLDFLGRETVREKIPEKVMLFAYSCKH